MSLLYIQAHSLEAMGISNSSIAQLEQNMTTKNTPPITPDNLFVIYVNLDHRTDRKQQIERQLQNVGWLGATHREGATKHSVHPYYGVPESHISCLKKGLASHKPYIAIFEDDFDFFVSPQDLAVALAELETIKFDVFLLDPGHLKTKEKPTHHPHFFKVDRSVSTAGYLLPASYAPNLIQNFVSGKHLLHLFPEKHLNFCIDRYWSSLQKRDMWLRYYKRTGGQRSSYSDIEQRNTNYNRIQRINAASN